MIFEESIINDKKTYLDQLSTRSNKISMYLKSSSNGLCFLVRKASFYPFLMHLNLIILTKINLEHNTHRTIFFTKKHFLFKKDMKNIYKRWKLQRIHHNG